MTIRKATTNDVKEIQSLIQRAVKPESNADFDEEGIRQFIKPNELPAIKDRIINEEYLTLCFVQKERIVGIITIHNNEKIDQLFVDPSSRNYKVSKQLWHAAKEICAENGNNGKYWVKSSTMAVPVYESFGFRLDGTLQKKNGITYYPMVLES